MSSPLIDVEKQIIYMVKVKNFPKKQRVKKGKK